MRWQHENFHQDHIFTIGQNAIGHINGADVLLIEFFKKVSTWSQDHRLDVQMIPFLPFEISSLEWVFDHPEIFVYLRK